MRILHLDAGKEMRGGQWQVLRLIGGLASAGVESTLLARSGAPLKGIVSVHGNLSTPLPKDRAFVIASLLFILAKSRSLSLVSLGKENSSKRFFPWLIKTSFDIFFISSSVFSLKQSRRLSKVIFLASEIR